MNNRTTGKASQSGVALIVALLAVLVLSILAAAIMTTSQAQIWTAINYRLTAQSRYAAESGVQKTMNWLASSSYTLPTTATYASYDMTKNPVQYGGKAVVLSAMSGVSSNYPDATVVTAYQAAASSSLPGVPNASYSTYATLLRMTQGTGASFLSATGGGVIQTWQITSQGSITGVRNSSVQVVETFERPGMPVFPYAVEATGTGCAAINFSGGATTSFTDSYDSTLGPYGGTNVQASGGNIAANGNVTLGSPTNIEGTISTPNPVVSSSGCSSPTNTITVASGATYSGTSKLNSLLAPPLPFGCAGLPCYPSPLPPTTAQAISTSCATIPGCTTNPTTNIVYGGSLKAEPTFTLIPGNYGNLTLANADIVHLSAGTYTVNSFNLLKDGQIVIDSGPVVLEFAGQGYAAGSVVFNSGGLSGYNYCSGGAAGNPGALGVASCGGAAKTPISGIPTNLQVAYAGPATIGATGAPCAGLIYAPNALVNMTGAPLAFYGSIITSTFLDTAKSPVHFDNSAKTISQVGNFRPVGGFSWSKF